LIARESTRGVRQLVVAVAVLIGAALAASPCWSQDSSGITDSVFTNPGARSIALGGAFAAIADDATAAFANPAGLVQILRPELSVELRGTAAVADSDTPYDVANSVSGLGFFSFDPLDLRREFSVRSYAAAAAFEVGEHLSLGAGLSYFDGKRTALAGVSEVSDGDWGLNAGVLWNPSPVWRFGGFYRQGPEFESATNPGSQVSAARFLHTKKLLNSAPFTFPDEYGVAAAFQPKAGALTIGFEWDQVGSAVDPLFNGHVVTEGGSEYHLGAEYAVLRWKPVVAFRAGFWRGSGRSHDVVNGSVEDESFYSGGQTHVAFGFGLAFKSFQIDVGTELYEQAAVGSVSFVLSF
jgi:hypothetical protein